MMQEFVYDEFLASFLSPAAMEKFGLSSTANFEYDAGLDPTISNAFGIAYRYVFTNVFAVKTTWYKLMDRSAIKT